jgi:hypothetical protein
VIGRLEALIVSHNNGNFTNYRSPEDDPTDPAANEPAACCWAIEDYYTYNETEDGRITSLSNAQAEGLVGSVITTTALNKAWVTELTNSQKIQIYTSLTESIRGDFANADIQTNNVKIPGTYGAPVTYTTNNYYDYLYWTWLLAEGVEGGTWDVATQATTINKTQNTSEDFKNKSKFLEYLTNSSAKDKLTIIDNNTTWVFADISVHYLSVLDPSCDSAPMAVPIVNNEIALNISEIISNNILDTVHIAATDALTENYTVEVDIELQKDNTYTESKRVGKTTFIYQHTNTSTPTVSVYLRIL